MSRKKEWVKERYGAIATDARQGCCGPGACCGGSAAQTAQVIGYQADELGAAPEGANLGLGCGNPLALAEISPGETVLDLGSGAGFDAFLAASRVGPTGRVIGVDITPEMVARATANAKRAGITNAEFRLGDIEALPIEDASVDLVISNCVINLTPDKGQVFREIARVLKPGGRVAISDLVLDGLLPQRLRDDPDAHCSCIGGAIARSDYLGAMEEAGLAAVRVVSEADATDLVAGDCGARAEELRGVITSISVTARRPA